MEALWRDLVLAARLLRRSPVFTAAAMLTLALGVAANVAVFSVVNAFIMRPLPVRYADWLVVIATKTRSSQMVAQATARRRHEIRVRMALGATSRDIVQLILRDGLRLLGLGLSAGLMAAEGGASALERFLFGVSAHDTVTFVAVAVTLACVTVLACMLPAWRRGRIDPLLALHTE